MKRAARVVAPLALVAGLALARCEGPRYEGPYDTIVLISLDTLRADHVGAYGDARHLTPALDALAAEGVVFEDATTAAPTTLASHASILTGTWPHTHGVPRNGFSVAPENETLAELLRAAGFQTAAFIGSFALDRRFGLDRGFEVWDERFDLDVDAKGLRQGGAPRTYDQTQRRAEQVTDAALAWIAEAPREPTFLFVHYFDAHAPWDPPEPFASRLVPEGLPRAADLADLREAVRVQQARFLEDPPGYDRTIVEGLPPELVERFEPEPSERDRALAALYAAEIAYLDVHVGRLLEGLRAVGRLERALIVVLSDHGETFAEHFDLWNHGLWVNETTARVPLVLWRSPELRAAGEAGRRVATPVSTIDVLPSVLELALLAPGARAEGASLAPALGGSELRSREVVCEATQPVREDVELGGWANRAKPRALRSGPWKLVDAPLLGLRRLYRLDLDPDERADRADDPAAASVLAELERQLGAWAARARPLPSQRLSATEDDVRRVLLKLGYTEGDEEPPEEREREGR